MLLADVGSEPTIRGPAPKGEAGDFEINTQPSRFLTKQTPGSHILPHSVSRYLSKRHRSACRPCECCGRSGRCQRDSVDSSRKRSSSSSQLFDCSNASEPKTCRSSIRPAPANHSTAGWHHTRKGPHLPLEPLPRLVPMKVSPPPVLILQLLLRSRTLPPQQFPRLLNCVREAPPSLEQPR